MTENKPQYRVVPTQVDLAELEHQILEFWEQSKTFETSLEQSKDCQPWVFFEGPPTANGTPGTHHVEARVFKDVFPRFKTMQGFRVDRKAGWDCHGLPVELAVEKELGFNGKQDIEAYGIEAFNKKCRQSVLANVDAFSQMTRRMGYWVNLEEAYTTMSAQFVESVWWALKTIFDKGLLCEDYRVAPYCPRCGTTLSDHELAQGYEDVSDPSIFVKFPVTSGPLAGQAKLLVWTTTPWTLISNTAVAVHPEVSYVVASKDGEQLVCAKPLFDKVLGEEWTVVQQFQGTQMEHWTYDRPYTLIPFDKPANFVVLADYVTTEDGTGLVHQAPAFGADDMAVCRRYNLPMVNPVQPDGAFDSQLPLVGGKFFKSADSDIVADLKERDILFRVEMHEHSYPHCWRCHTPLLYYAQPSWYIRTTHVRDAMIEHNENTTWHPETIKHGRFGDWLENNIDWALSRKRYWGTPLPIWRNELDPQKLICVGSLKELGEYAGKDLSNLDPHRPYVDDITFEIEGIDGVFRRVPEVVDGWFDSGSMPFAQWGYPWVEGSKEKFESHFPADFIAEAIDQTRGWFYTLLAVSTLVFGKSSYKNVICLGLLLAEDGRKMSKHLGNILLPIPLMDEHGADALRWFMASGGSPWAARRVGHATLQEIVRKVLLTYWNTVSFQALYARVNHWSVTDQQAPEHVLDRWLASATQELVRDVTLALENFDTLRAGTLLADFVDLLSNWYVRRSRRRFWDGDPGALSVLHNTLVTVTQLMAPITPFITERVWQDLVAVDPAQPRSVHLSAWPTWSEDQIDATLDENMRITRRLVELGRAARAESKMKTRQPLARILIPTQAFQVLPEELLAEISAELNVQEVASFAGAGDLVDYSAKGNFRALGKRFGKTTPLVAQAISQCDAALLVKELSSHGKAQVGEWEVSPEEVLITERPREGWSVVNEQGETVALDLELTPDLVAAGLAREVVRFVQDSRKKAGLDVSDRINLTWHAPADLAQAIQAHQDTIAEEVLAIQMQSGTPDQTWVSEPELGLQIHLSKATV